MTTTYTCKRCGHICERIAHLFTHLQKKKVCKPLYEDVERSSILLELETKEGRMKNQTMELHKSGVFGDSKHRIAEEVTDKDAYIRELQEENSKLRKANMELMMQMQLVKTGGSITNHNTNSNNVYNITNHIHINNYGSENRSYLTDKVMSRLLEKVYNSVPMLIKELHFNPKHPENHNIRYPNKKEKYLLVKRSGGEWSHVDKREFIEELTRKGHGYLEDAYENTEILSHLKPEKRKYYEMYLDRMDSEEGEVLGDICSRVEVVLLNARYNGTSTLVRG